MSRVFSGLSNRLSFYSFLAINVHCRCPTVLSPLFYSSVSGVGTSSASPPRCVPSFLLRYYFGIPSPRIQTAHWMTFVLRVKDVRGSTVARNSPVSSPLMTADCVTTQGVRPTPVITYIRFPPRNSHYCRVALAGFHCDQWCSHIPMEPWLCGSCSPAASRHPPSCDVKHSSVAVPLRTGIAPIISYLFSTIDTLFCLFCLFLRPRARFQGNFLM